ncbi:response regulator [Niveispirillum fermenti]|uniref:response regulator n=1 Tax=Niveispirillum fermenti TaxID=1233113 RepID=UPI003A8584D1
MLNRDQIPGFEKLSVLLVEDNVFAQRLARQVLIHLGIQNIHIVKDGKAAIEALEDSELRYDLIISDWNMPNVTGLQLLQHVRKTWENMPFLMLTGNQTADFVHAARANKVDAYIVKPFSPMQLRQKICAIFNIKP